MISISRNRPVALVVGAAGFLGSFLVENLLEKNIQVIGLDDLSTGKKSHLVEASKSKDFFFLIQPAQNWVSVDTPRLDYLFILLPEDLNLDSYELVLRNLFKETKDLTPKILLISSIEAYDKDNSSFDSWREVEKRFAYFAKNLKANARIMRLSAVYGPRMRFSLDDPLIRLIKSSVKGDLHKETEPLDFTTRALFVTDAVDLITRAVLAGGTAHKIYDGAMLHPLKVSEVRQVLLDPLWYESRGFEPTRLPPWPTPNLERTLKELHFRTHTDLVPALKQTVVYFKDHPDLVEKEFPQKPISLPPRPFWGEEGKELKNKSTEQERSDQKDKTISDKETKKRFFIRIPRINKGMLVVMVLISYALLYPVARFAVGALTIRYHLREANSALASGDFQKAKSEIAWASEGVGSIQDIYSSLVALQAISLTSDYYQSFGQLLEATRLAIMASSHAVEGTEALYATAQVVTGANEGDPKQLLEKAVVELTTADQQFSEVLSQFQSSGYIASLPDVLQSRIEDLKNKVSSYQQLTSKARSVALVLPGILAVDSKKSYLVLLQNNMELRPGGGFIGSYAQIDFDHGKLTNLKVDDIYNLDGALREKITPPTEIQNDLGQKEWYLRDSNFDPDFPTSAKTSQWFYQKESGVRVSGVIGLDLSASQKLLGAIGPLELVDYQETVNSDNLFERAIAHAEVSFFPGSQSKKNFLTALQSELLNKTFFLEKQNWPAIIQAVGESLDEKHVLFYVQDPTTFSYLTSLGWSGVMPRQAKEKIGEREGFLAISEANLGANKANYYLQRETVLNTGIGKDGEVNHTLAIDYTNTSPSEVWPAGKYKNRFRIYLPQGTKLTKVNWGETDILPAVSSFVEYERAGYSMLLELNPKEKKRLVLEYQDAKPLEFQDQKVRYATNIIKQPGTLSDPFTYHLSYGLNYQLLDAPGSEAKKQEVTFKTDLNKDRSFEVELEKTK